MPTPVIPGGQMAHRPLHFFWVLDCSSSMSGSKIQSLNFALKECIPAMQDVAKENPESRLLVRALTFSDGAQWHLATPTPIDQFQWQDVHAGGTTSMGRAMELLADAMTEKAMGERALPPVIVLITDGQPTDNFGAGLKKLMALPWAKKAVRVGIAIGDDADQKVLEQFIDHPEFRPLKADNAPTLARYIKWVSTAVVGNVSAPVSQMPGAKPASNNIPLPAAPAAVSTAGLDPNDIW